MPSGIGRCVSARLAFPPSFLTSSSFLPRGIWIGWPDGEGGRDGQNEWRWGATAASGTFRRSVGGGATRTWRVFTQPRPYFAVARELPPAVMTADLRKRTDADARSPGIRRE